MYRARTLSASVAVIAAASLALTGCGAQQPGETEISFLTYAGDDYVGFAEQVAQQFTEKYPQYTVKVDTRPSGAEGDNLIKTRLATDEMSDVFIYNSGSLMQALAPDKTLVDLSDQSWVDSVNEDFVSVVSTDSGMYGAPAATSLAGGIVYNKKVYADLGLTVPESWDDFMANNEAIKAAGIDPVFQSYGDSWTSQVTVLGDFGNILAQDPDWATEYTAHKRFFADEPGLQSFQRLEDLHTAGMFNDDFASATFDDAARALAEGTAAQYPIVTTFMYAVSENFPEAANDLGFFAVPATDASDTQATIWQPDAVYIPATTTGAKLDAAKAFVEFLNSPEGCAAQNEFFVAVGPYVSACTLADDALDIVRDIEQYLTDGNSAPALEFLSPVKGPNLAAYTVEVGSGIRSAADAAALYDQDVEKQAQQLGLDGW